MILVKKITVLSLVSILLVTVCGCSVTNRGPKFISLTVHPADAYAIVNGVEYHTISPQFIEVNPNRELLMTVYKPGYKEEMYAVNNRLSSCGKIDAWASILIFPAIGLLTSGAWELEETNIRINLKPLVDESTLTIEQQETIEAKRRAEVRFREKAMEMDVPPVPVDDRKLKETIVETVTASVADIEAHAQAVKFASEKNAALKEAEIELATATKAREEARLAAEKAAEQEIIAKTNADKIIAEARDADAKVALAKAAEAEAINARAAVSGTQTSLKKAFENAKSTIDITKNELTILTEDKSIEPGELATKKAVAELKLNDAQKALAETEASMKAVSEKYEEALKSEVEAKKVLAQAQDEATAKSTAAKNAAANAAAAEASLALQKATEVRAAEQVDKAQNKVNELTLELRDASARVKKAKKLISAK